MSKEQISTHQSSTLQIRMASFWKQYLDDEASKLDISTSDLARAGITYLLQSLYWLSVSGETNEALKLKVQSFVQDSITQEALAVKMKMTEQVFGQYQKAFTNFQMLFADMLKQS